MENLLDELYQQVDVQESRDPGWMTPDLAPGVWSVVSFELTDLEVDEHEETDSTGEDAGWLSVEGLVTAHCKLGSGSQTITRVVKISFSGIARPAGADRDYEISTLTVAPPPGTGVSLEDL